MGIPGLFPELGPGERVSLLRYAHEHHQKTGRRLRLAIDASIWSFQVQSGKGGSNPALRTLFYRVLKLLSHNIYPFFVFDGPQRPSFKRNKRVNTTVTSGTIQLCKKLLKILGLGFHQAPGEAEAECAALQKKGVVDAVLSEDVDTLMFGAGKVIRNWSSENPRNKVTTHVTIYDAEVIKAQAQLDREGMVLVALMRGGDYLPGGIPSCGIRTGVEAARAGFAKDLFEAWGDERKMQKWRARLQHEINTNESKLFPRRNTKLKIPEDFPNEEVLANYNAPVISPDEQLERIETAVNWNGIIDIEALREYTRDTFEWRGTPGAAHFVRVMAPVLMSRYMLDNGPRIASLVEGLHTRRTHETTDNLPEIRVSFTPAKLIPIDKEREEADDILQSAEQSGVLEDLADEPLEVGGGARYNPYEPVRIWMLESHVMKSIPDRVQELEAGKKTARAKAPAKAPEKAAAAKPRATKAASKTTAASKADSGPLDRFLTATAGNIPSSSAPEPRPPASQPVFTRVNKPISSQPTKPRASRVPAAQASSSTVPIGSIFTKVTKPISTTASVSAKPRSPTPPTFFSASSPNHSSSRRITAIPGSPDSPDIAPRRRQPAQVRRQHTPPALLHPPSEQPPKDTRQALTTIDLDSSPVRTESRARVGSPGDVSVARKEGAEMGRCGPAAVGGRGGGRKRPVVIDLLDSDDEYTAPAPPPLPRLTKPTAKPVVKPKEVARPSEVQEALPTRSLTQKLPKREERRRVVTRDAYPGVFETVKETEEVKGGKVWENVVVLDLTGDA